MTSLCNENKARVQVFYNNEVLINNHFRLPSDGRKYCSETHDIAYNISSDVTLTKSEKKQLRKCVSRIAKVAMMAPDDLQIPSIIKHSDENNALYKAVNHCVTKCPPKVIKIVTDIFSSNNLVSDMFAFQFAHNFVDSNKKKNLM